MSKIKEMLQNIISKQEKSFSDVNFELFPKKINGYIDDLPLFVVDTAFQHDNEVTEYKSYLKETFNDNMFINKYTLSITVHVYGKDFLKQLDELDKKSRERVPVLFMYTKLNKIFGPLCITNFSYDENSENQTYVQVKFNFKEVQLLEFTTKDGVTITNVYNPNSSLQRNVELAPISLNETMTEKYRNDSRTGGINI